MQWKGSVWHGRMWGGCGRDCVGVSVVGKKRCGGQLSCFHFESASFSHVLVARQHEHSACWALCNCKQPKISITLSKRISQTKKFALIPTAALLLRSRSRSRSLLHYSFPLPVLSRAHDKTRHNKSFKIDLFLTRNEDHDRHDGRQRQWRLQRQWRWRRRYKTRPGSSALSVPHKQAPVRLASLNKKKRTVMRMQM